MSDFAGQLNIWIDFDTDLRVTIRMADSFGYPLRNGFAR